MGTRDDEYDYLFKGEWQAALYWRLGSAGALLVDGSSAVHHSQTEEPISLEALVVKVCPVSPIVHRSRIVTPFRTCVSYLLVFNSVVSVLRSDDLR